MPMYKFKCWDCEEEEEVFCSVSDREMQTPKCSCGKLMEQNFNSPNLFHQTDRERYSRAMAVDISQLESGEAQRAMPGVEFKIIGDLACPVIRNRADKKRIMKLRGFVEYEQETDNGKRDF